MNRYLIRTEETRDDWQTPAHIVDALGQFDLDPCANSNNPFRLASVGYPTGGLILPWSGRVWLNPPYGPDCRLWVRRLAEHGDGIALIPPRVGSHWFQEQVLSNCDAVLFLKGRVSFLDGNLQNIRNRKAGNNADSVLVAFGEVNAAILSVCGIPGVFWRLR